MAEPDEDGGCCCCGGCGCVVIVVILIILAFFIGRWTGLTGRNDDSEPVELSHPQSYMDISTNVIS